MGFAAGVFAAVLWMCFAANGAFAGWVVEMEVQTPGQGQASKGRTAPGEAGGPEGGKVTKVTKMTIKIQDKLAMVQREAGFIVIDGGSGDTLVSLPEKKMYARVDVLHMKAVMQSLLAQAGAPKDLVKAKATGKTDTINGYKVEEYVVELPGVKATFWVCKEGAEMEKVRDAIAGAFGKMSASAQQLVDFTSVPGVVIRTVVEVPAKDPSTEASKSMFTVKSIKEEALDAAVFKVPVDYKEIELVR